MGPHQKGPRAVATNGVWAWVAVEGVGLGVVDATDPAAPLRLDDLPLAGDLSDVEQERTLLYVAAGDSASISWT